MCIRDRGVDCPVKNRGSKNRGKFWSTTLSKLPPLFHWAQAEPTGYRDISDCLSPWFWLWLRCCSISAAVCSRSRWSFLWHILSTTRRWELNLRKASFSTVLLALVGFYWLSDFAFVLSVILLFDRLYLVLVMIKQFLIVNFLKISDQLIVNFS